MPALFSFVGCEHVIEGWVRHAIRGRLPWLRLNVTKAHYHLSELIKSGVLSVAHCALCVSPIDAPLWILVYESHGLNRIRQDNEAKSFVRRFFVAVSK